MIVWTTSNLSKFLPSDSVWTFALISWSVINYTLYANCQVIGLHWLQKIGQWGPWRQIILELKSPTRDHSNLCSLPLVASLALVSLFCPTATPKLAPRTTATKTRIRMARPLFRKVHPDRNPDPDTVNILALTESKTHGQKTISQNIQNENELAATQSWIFVIVGLESNWKPLFLEKISGS